jgi:hypothetical protein
MERRNREGIRLPRVVDRRDMARFALENGCELVPGGRDTWKIRTPSGDTRPLPGGRGDLSRGVTQELRRWIHQST